MRRPARLSFSSIRVSNAPECMSRALASGLLQSRGMRFVTLLVMLAGVPGCMLFFDDGGKRPPVCDLAQSEDEPASLPAPLRDPDGLTCEQFGGGCDPACGPCAETTKGADLAPLPTWGVCGSICESLDETACAASAECRVVRDARCAIAGSCTTDFAGCFPIDTAPDPTIDCLAARDGWTCSRSAACTALHDTAVNCPDNGTQCRRPFGLCVKEGTDPGHCKDDAVCDIPGPNCPQGTTAGVANGCYTGACIPLALCEASS